MSDERPEQGTDAPALAVLSGHSKRTCGLFGGRKVTGEPCGQAVPLDRERCPWHPVGLTPDEEAKHRSAVAAEGGRRSRLPKRAPGSAPDPHFDTPPKIVRWCEKTTGEVLRGTLTDYKALDASVRLARLALDALGVQALDQLDQLERLVRNRLQRGAPA